MEPTKCKYPSTTIVETRVDIRILATLLSFYKKNGSDPVSRSSLVKMVLEDLYQSLDNKDCIKFDDTKEAKRYIEESLGTYGRDNRISQAIFKQVVREKGVEVETVTSGLDKPIEEDAEAQAKIDEMLKDMGINPDS